MADIRTSCPHCNQTIEAPEEMAGQVAGCPTCGGEMVIPGAEATQEAGGNICPNCQSAMAPNSVLCVACGFHTGLGKVMTTDLS